MSAFSDSRGWQGWERAGILNRMSRLPFTPKNTLPFIIVLAVLVPIYLSTLQTIPNGSENYYMIDVGETQNVLNQWGTLHATGYPLYVMVGNALVAGSIPAVPDTNTHSPSTRARE